MIFSRNTASRGLMLCLIGLGSLLHGVRPGVAGGQAGGAAAPRAATSPYAPAQPIGDADLWRLPTVLLVNETEEPWNRMDEPSEAVFGVLHLWLGRDGLWHVRWTGLVPGVTIGVSPLRGQATVRSRWGAAETSTHDGLTAGLIVPLTSVSGEVVFDVPYGAFEIGIVAGQTAIVLDGLQSSRAPAQRFQIAPRRRLANSDRACRLVGRGRP